MLQPSCHPNSTCCICRCFGTVTVQSAQLLCNKAWLNHSWRKAEQQKLHRTFCISTASSLTHCKKTLINCLQLTCSMLQPSFHSNSTSLLEHSWSNNRSFLGLSPCQLQAVEQVFFAVTCFFFFELEGLIKSGLGEIDNKSQAKWKCNMSLMRTGIGQRLVLINRGYDDKCCRVYSTGMIISLLVIKSLSILYTQWYDSLVKKENKTSSEMGPCTPVQLVQPSCVLSFVHRIRHLVNLKSKIFFLKCWQSKILMITIISQADLKAPLVQSLAPSPLFLLDITMSYAPYIIQHVWLSPNGDIIQAANDGEVVGLIYSCFHRVKMASEAFRQQSLLGCENLKLPLILLIVTPTMFMIPSFDLILRQRFSCVFKHLSYSLEHPMTILSSTFTQIREHSFFFDKV
ncbi:hypothetical protein VP01_1449g4 [Puccinia sorghi]|uniref:Uncharacterized protein n=1 Tax=Puccinia sorghi TaxID=27349 RepID=A0A0L6VK85_9BASI|nr:hypothetical protein VP01_1449g4 [Puccinia sorghi]